MNTQTKLWLDKPYYSLDAYCKNHFHEKCYKISLNAGFTCPNRDGTIDSRGCIFCSAGGSGDFAIPINTTTMEEAIQSCLKQATLKSMGRKYIGYFQAYTNTYAHINTLEKLYRKALDSPDIIGISIATRPDCISKDIIHLCEKLRIEYAKFIWIELGLQTIHEETAIFIRRGYSLSVFEDAMALLAQAKLPVIVHVILGLPKETKQHILETIHYLNTYSIFGIKLQLLHVLKDTDLGKLYINPATTFPIYTLDEYLQILIHCIEVISPDVVIHRITGDGPKDLLLAPLWSLNKRHVLNTLHQQMRQKKTYQGRCYHDSRSTYTL